MPFINKEIEFSEFMERLHRRIQKGGNAAALSFFKCFLRDELPREVMRQAVSGWNGRVVAGDFDVIYPEAAKIFLDAATRNASECHPDIYEEASAVSLAFCGELNELFQCSGDGVFDFIPIKPYSEMAVEAGLLERVRGPDGQTLVRPTGKCEAIVRAVRQEINRDLN